MSSGRARFYSAAEVVSFAACSRGTTGGGLLQARQSARPQSEVLLLFPQKKRRRFASLTPPPAISLSAFFPFSPVLAKAPGQGKKAGSLARGLSLTWPTRGAGQGRKERPSRLRRGGVGAESQPASHRVTHAEHTPANPRRLTPDFPEGGAGTIRE
ncbi:Hypothetical predicted protein [Podarcis lilfordi]|uniref:Uncharacterized protein n=1 Tax=Podarcis lilfordi TaxID=74358 RepID=A0AA35KFP3_9SAUR|nr:Hypothetical predicted protein [Podarcis lilfordi]